MHKTLLASLLLALPQLAIAAGNEFTNNRFSESHKWRPDPHLPGGRLPHTSTVQYIRGRGSIEKLRLPAAKPSTGRR